MTEKHIDWDEVMAAITDKETATVEANEHLDRLVFPLLTDEQLWWVIKQAQIILDDRYPMNSTDLRCPECGHEERFRVELYQWAELHKNGAEVDTDYNPDWTAECACVCRECDHLNHLWRFMKAWSEVHPEGEVQDQEETLDEDEGDPQGEVQANPQNEPEEDI